MTVKIEMDMPKCCYECKLTGNEDVCQLVDFDCIILYRSNRHPKCPLKECK